MKQPRNFFVLFLILLSAQVNGQAFNPKKLEAAVARAIARAYPASVRIWGFDTLSNTRTSGQFTGVVVSENGCVLTAAHVNQPGNTYKIMFPDGRTAIAMGLGEIDLEESPGIPDVAMMKITGNKKWPFAEMGWSSAILKNEPCISIAYPESLDQPLPMIRFGHIQEVKNQYGFVQSTCLMEPGDSGGPLFDYMGRVIGLHSAIDLAESDNFEIPVDLYRKYRRALTKPEAYKSFPAVTDTVGNDPLAKNIKAIAALDHIDANLKWNAKLKANSILLKSTIRGREEKIQAALILLKGMPIKGELQDGHLLISKSSMVGDNPMVAINEAYFAAMVIARDKENDLVLLKTVHDIKGGIRLNQFKLDTIDFARLGKFLVSPLSHDTSRISVLGSMQFGLAKVTSIGYIGAQIAYFGPLIFETIPPQQPASDLKLEKGDELLSINGVVLKNRADYVRESKKYWPDDKITIQVKRGEHIFSKEVMLDSKPQIISKHPAEKFAGGKSTLRDGFKQVFAHDAILKPNQTGGPVFDLEGNFYGVNIARFSRTSTLVIPAKAVLDFIIANYK